LAISPSSVTVQRGGGTATYTVTIQRTGGFSSPVNFVVGGLPSGAAGTFNPNPATSSSVLTVTVPSTVSRGSYPLTVTGTGGAPSIQHTATATLVKVQQK
jgi:serine protease AprX